MRRQNSILLESGTNELEVFEFKVGQQGYGINVLKIKQILEHIPEDVISTPGTHASVLGVLRFEGLSTPIIDMRTYLEKKEGDYGPKVILMVEFNMVYTGLLVDGVNKIYRISWEDIQSVQLAARSDIEKVVGICHIENRQVVLLDYESILADVMGKPKVLVNPNEALLNAGQVEKFNSLHLLIADDSALIRGHVEDVIKKLGYKSYEIFDNGKSLVEAFMHCKTIGSSKEAIIVITDIEMPQMDGLTACKKIKEISPNTKVIVMSSLINEQMIEKCRSVQADETISKKQLNNLAGHLSKFIQAL